MAQAPSAERTTPPREGVKTAPKRPRRRPRNGQANKRTSSASQISELEEVIRGLELRLASFGGGRDGIRSAVTGASNQVGEVVADTLTEVVDRLKDRVFTVTEAARVSTGLLGRLTTEVERRPIMTVFIALGVGFLAGMAGRAAEAPDRRH
jgi:hypothetical protein